ncbi:uncharacterized protein AB9W97_016567 isoform 3-T3 [Spinachia spinachia]
MAEEEVNYASVVFNSDKQRHRANAAAAAKEDDTVYDEVKVKSEAGQQSADSHGRAPSGQRRRGWLAGCLAIACVLLLLGLVGVAIHRKNTELKAQIQQLTEDNQEQKENFTKQIQVLEDNGETSNVSRAQWSIDSYCPKKEVLSGRTCSACQKGWKKNQQRCYVIHDSEGTSDLKTWEEAQENCRERAADLVVVHDEEEKRIIDDYSANFRVSNGYWIGLRAKGGTWKWIDGTTLTDISWIEAPAEGHCGVSLSTRRWTSVKCDEKRTRICTRNALSL